MKDVTIVWQMFIIAIPANMDMDSFIWMGIILINVEDVLIIVNIVLTLPNVMNVMMDLVSLFQME